MLYLPSPQSTSAAKQMPFDALTISAVRDELREKLVEGRVQNVLSPGPLSISLEVYRAGVGRSHLLISAHPQHARIHLLPAAPSRDPSQTPPLLLLLRKYVRGGILLDVTQPPLERVVVLSIAKRITPHKHQEYRSDWDFLDTEDALDEPEEPDAPVVRVQIIAEIMGRVSNIVLVGEDETVLDSIKRIPSSINRYRVILPNHHYVPPPRQSKRDAAHTTINALALEIGRAASEHHNAPAWKGIVSGYAGVSPTLAREAVYRALGTTRASAQELSSRPDLLAGVLRELQSLLSLSTGSWEPVLAHKESAGGGLEPLDFAPFPLRHLEAEGATLRRCATISEAARLFYEGLEGGGRHAALRASVASRIAEMAARDERKLAALREEWRRAQALEQIRHKGEMLLAYMHRLAPGQTRLEIPEEGLAIDIDPSFSPSENAQAIFREYRKAKSAVEGLPARIEEAERRVAFVEELVTSLELAQGYDEIMSVSREVDAAHAPPGTARQPEQRGKPGTRRGAREQAARKLPQPLRLETTRGLSLLVGRTAGQNDAATFRLAGPEDLWFHARNAPGAHVILRTTPQPSEEDIVEAAGVAAAFSKLRNDAQVDVIYTERKHVRKIPDAPPGQVTYRNERTVRVSPGRPQAAER